MDVAMNRSSLQLGHKIDCRNQGSKQYFECYLV